MHGLSNGFRIDLTDTSLSVSAFISENKTNNSPATVLQSLLKTTIVKMTWIFINMYGLFRLIADIGHLPCLDT